MKTILECIREHCINECYSHWTGSNGWGSCGLSAWALRQREIESEQEYKEEAERRKTSEKERKEFKLNHMDLYKEYGKMYVEHKRLSEQMRNLCIAMPDDAIDDNHLSLSNALDFYGKGYDSMVRDEIKIIKKKYRGIFKKYNILLSKRNKLDKKMKIMSDEYPILLRFRYTDIK